jgi:hypothetical protein
MSTGQGAWWAPTLGVKAVAKRNIFCLCRELNPSLPVRNYCYFYRVLTATKMTVF